MQIVIFKLPVAAKNQIEAACPDVEMGKMIGEATNKSKAKAIAVTVHDEYLTVAVAVSNPARVISSVFHRLNHDRRLISQKELLSKRFNLCLTKHEVIEAPAGLGKNAIIQIFISAEVISVPITGWQRQELKGYTNQIEVKYQKPNAIHWVDLLLKKTVIQPPQGDDSDSTEALTFSGVKSLILKKIKGADSDDQQIVEKININISDLTPEMYNRANSLGKIFLRDFCASLNSCTVSMFNGLMTVRSPRPHTNFILELEPGNHGLLNFVELEKHAEHFCLWNPFKAQWVWFDPFKVSTIENYLQKEILPLFLDPKQPDQPVLDIQVKASEIDKNLFWNNLKKLSDFNPEYSWLYNTLILAYSNARYLSQGKP